MFRRSRIVWKLSAVFITIILLVFVVLGFVNNLVDEHYALAAAGDLCRFNSATMQQSIGRLLMTRDNTSIKEMIDNLARDNPVYREMRLVSHSGQIAVSRYESSGERLPQDSRPCQVCHRLDDPLVGAAVPSHDEILELPDGTRVISVITPILNEPTCSTADCHAHADAPPVLGFLQTDYSLSRVDALTAARSLHAIIAALVAIVLGTLGTWLTAARLLGRPMRVLVTGMERVARGDLGFRLNVHRKDEFAIVAESFNEMTAKLEVSLSELELSLYELRETKDYLEGIVENSADIIITVNPSGLIETFNTGAELVLGYSREEVIGQKIEKLFADPKERDLAIARLQHSDNVINYETRFLTKSGEVRNVILTLSRLRGPDGEPIGTFGISKDVTTEKKLQLQLIQSEKFAAIGQSFTAIQHAMKNMLNALSGGSYMVKTGIGKHDWQMLADGWKIVTEGISSISELSRNLLKYVKDWEPELERGSIGKIIERIDSVIAQTASDQGVAFAIQVPPELPDVYCDSSLIHSAIMDIVSNALEACLSKEYEDGESPRIDLTVKQLHGSRKLAIEVRDNGPGMTKDVAAHIFTPFFSTKKKKGTGLGLALTARIVSLHNGTIDVLPELGRGVTFRILLPVAGPEKSKEDSDAEESADHR